MDFIDWAGRVFLELERLHKADTFSRSIGVDETKLSAAMFGESFSSDPAYHTSQERMALLDALRELEGCDLLDQNKKAYGHYRPSSTARQLEGNFLPLWQVFCSEKLDAEHEEFLATIAELSQVEAPNFARVEETTHDALIAKLGWPEGMDRIWPVAQELDERGMISWTPTMGPAFRAWITYRGLVWLNKRAFTAEAVFIDGLVDEWETTSVDFKREVHTDKPGEKAEFVKDLLSLANTQASGQRWLIIGFDDKTRDWVCPPDAKLTQNHIEQLMSAYAEPVVDVRYEVLDYRAGKVGKLEVLRNPQKLPYRVKKSVGDAKKRIEAGQVFVRHGSQVEEPTAPELRALEEEADRARNQA